MTMDIPVSDRQFLRIAKIKYKNNLYLDYRAVYKTKTGEFKPTKRGFRIQKQYGVQLCQNTKILIK